ncbi:hypothetical protein EAHG_04991 [Escherichia coli B671]|nr:hypothetical protein EAHG_04991 [Escherichia coli B671]
MISLGILQLNIVNAVSQMKANLSVKQIWLIGL